MVGTGITGVAGVAGAAISYGVLRQKVSDLRGRADIQDQKLDKLAEAVSAAADVRNQVALLSARTDASHSLLLEKQMSAQSLMLEKIDGLRGEVRSFMQGQASFRGSPAKAS